MSRPPEYILYTPVLFHEWRDWAEIHENEKNNIDSVLEKNNNEIVPLGTKTAPSWVKYDFNNLEEFYIYYNSLLNKGE